MPRRLLISLLLTLALVASACGSSGSGDTAEVTEGPTVAPTSSPSVAPTPGTPTPVTPTLVTPTLVTPTLAATATAVPATAVPTALPATAVPTATAVPEPTTDAELYDAPGALELPLPLATGQAPGTIIDTEDITIAGATAMRILYHSTSAQGAEVAVSGFVAYPDGEPPDGGWPLIAWAHGTTGLGDSCAPSNNAETDQLAQALVPFGYAVVATDYEGLGTPGTHPYVVGASEAHGVLDSVRAVFELDLPVSDDWIVFGHSQGGHAAMFTGQLQPTYAPELDLIGVVAGAPPSQLADLNDALIGGNFQGYLIMTAAGLVAADDALALSDVLSPAAISLIDVVETGCTAEIFEVYNAMDYGDATVVDDPFSLPAWSAALAENDTNRLPVEVPLLIVHGGDDEQIPIETSAILFTQLCAFERQGPTVRNVYAGRSHAGVLTSEAAVLDVLSWVSSRFAGETAPNDCPT